MCKYLSLSPESTTLTEFCHFSTPLREQFLNPERGQKQTFFDPLLLVHVVIEWTLSIDTVEFKSQACSLGFRQDTF